MLNLVDLPVGISGMLPLFVRAELVEACASPCFAGASNKPGLAPAGDSLSLASPRESKQREGEPDSSALR